MKSSGLSGKRHKQPQRCAASASETFAAPAKVFFVDVPVSARGFDSKP
ncbi:MAG: hypothetical protein U1E85_07090 [Rhodocyclaceae bacterium]|nr:hypothetical protein [Azospira sp.]HNN47105.1 hypothetical protein [Azospira sp.]